MAVAVVVSYYAGHYSVTDVSNSAKYGVIDLRARVLYPVFVVVNMPVPWEALIPFGMDVLARAVVTPAERRELIRSCHRVVWRRWNAV